MKFIVFLQALLALSLGILVNSLLGKNKKNKSKSKNKNKFTKKIIEFRQICDSSKGNECAAGLECSSEVKLCLRKVGERCEYDQECSTNRCRVKKDPKTNHDYFYCANIIKF